MPIWPGENDWKANRKAGEGENNKGQVTRHIFKLFVALVMTKNAKKVYKMCI